MRPRIAIVSPAAAAANNGNWHTAARWADMLAPVAEVQVLQRWVGEPVDTLIALHARKSAASIAEFCAAGRGAAIAVLTGTDLYRDLPDDLDAQRSLDLASRIVVLQSKALDRLPDRWRAKAVVIEQSAPYVLEGVGSTWQTTFVAIGHLREEKDPRTLMRAARLLRHDTNICIEHIGHALDDELAEEARRTAVECPRYRWIPGLPHEETRRVLARSHALVHPSRLEGGANVVIEAVRSRVPVLASEIDGNLGLLGCDYPGYFPVGDAEVLVSLMRRFVAEANFVVELRDCCRGLEQRFDPVVEAAAVRALLR